MDKLDEIMAYKAEEITERIRPVRDSELERLGRLAPQRPGFRDALTREGGLAVIAEIKRRSPSAGLIKELPAAEEQARCYVNAGADAMSILTDEKYFGGTLKDLWEVTDFLSESRRQVPCLRKDFMLHPVQVVEAAEAGASSILIIVRALTDEQIHPLHESAQMAGLDVLFEIHSEAELERAVNHGADIIGVNNRDLAQFVTNLEFSERLIPMIPENVVKISESGIFGVEEATRARACGADAILVGEALMKAEDTDELVELFHHIDEAM